MPNPKQEIPESASEDNTDFKRDDFLAPRFASAAIRRERRTVPRVALALAVLALAAVVGVFLQKPFAHGPTAPIARTRAPQKSKSGQPTHSVPPIHSKNVVTPKFSASDRGVNAVAPVPSPLIEIPAREEKNEPDAKVLQWTPDSGNPPPTHNMNSPEADFLFED